MELPGPNPENKCCLYLFNGSAIGQRTAAMSVCLSLSHCSCICATALGLLTRSATASKYQPGSLSTNCFTILFAMSQIHALFCYNSSTYYQISYPFILLMPSIFYRLSFLWLHPVGGAGISDITLAQHRSVYFYTSCALEPNLGKDSMSAISATTLVLSLVPYDAAQLQFFICYSMGLLKAKNHVNPVLKSHSIWA